MSSSKATRKARRQSNTAAVRLPEIEALPDRQLQSVLLAAVRTYASRRTARQDLDPFPSGQGRSPLAATDVMITVTAMLKAAGIEVFELGMWQAWTGVNQSL